MQLGITCFLPEDVPTAAKYAYIMKIASFESADPEMMAALHGCQRQVVISTGMMDEDGIYQIVSRTARLCATLLHCTSAYPAPLEDVQLGVVVRLLDGLSDHSRDLDMGMMAVCAGAQIIETHYRLYDCDPENPDYPVSFDPGELAMYVSK